ncbi:MAG TPA: nucleotidyltransferase family protein, partial [Methylophilaceae bacterium]|nr:nucleotidyltransferase family protein [Methylophilaceae bacterium]
IERLARAGFKEVVINHAYLGSQIEEALGDGSKWGINIQYSPEKEALETAGGIANALPLLGDSPFLVVNGDVYTAIDFSLELESPYLAHLVMVDNPPQHPQGDFVLDSGVLKPDGLAKLTYSGVGVYSPQLFKDIVKGDSAKLAPLLLSAMASNLISGEYYHGIWHDIGTPDRLKLLDASLSKRDVHS